MRLRRKGRLMGRWILRQLKDSENYDVGYSTIHVGAISIDVSFGECSISYSDEGNSIWVPRFWRWLIERKVNNIYLDKANNKLKIW